MATTTAQFTGQQENPATHKASTLGPLTPFDRAEYGVLVIDPFVDRAMGASKGAGHLLGRSVSELENTTPSTVSAKPFRNCSHSPKHVLMGPAAGAAN